jgi:AcrR family transcriptional regulator
MARWTKTSRTALLRESLRIVEREGLGSLSIRAVAKNLGLAPNAIYHYYPGRVELEADVAREGWKRLLAVLLRARGKLQETEAIDAQVRAFVRFTRQHDALYRLMLLPRPDSPEEHAIRQRYREFNAVSYGAFVPLDQVDDARRLVWSLLHGMISLYRSGLTPEIQDIEREAVSAVRLFLTGMTKRAR